ncbi:MAG: LysR substrate-binding domain-containing protein, partial [Pseudolabrys sp.]
RKSSRRWGRCPRGRTNIFAAPPPSPDWIKWFSAAGVDDVDLRRGLRFNSADHALDATSEGAGVLLAYDLLAYDDLRTGRLVIPVKLALPSRRAFHIVWPKGRKPRAAAQAFRVWLKQEIAALDWRHIKTKMLTPRE